MDFPTLGKFVGGAATIIGALYGGGTFVDNRYAHQGDVQLISMRLEQKVLTDRASQIQQRIWKIEDRYGSDLKEAPETVKEEYRQLKMELNDLDHELNAVQQEYRSVGKSNEGYYDKESNRSKY